MRDEQRDERQRDDRHKGQQNDQRLVTVQRSGRADMRANEIEDELSDGYILVLYYHVAPVAYAPSTVQRVGTRVVTATRQCTARSRPKAANSSLSCPA